MVVAPVVDVLPWFGNTVSHEAVGDTVNACAVAVAARLSVCVVGAVLPDVYENDRLDGVTCVAPGAVTVRDTWICVLVAPGDCFDAPAHTLRVRARLSVMAAQR